MVIVSLFTFSYGCVLASDFTNHSSYFLLVFFSSFPRRGPILSRNSITAKAQFFRRMSPAAYSYICFFVDSVPEEVTCQVEWKEIRFPNLKL